MPYRVQTPRSALWIARSAPGHGAADPRSSPSWHPVLPPAPSCPARLSSFEPSEGIVCANISKMEGAAARGAIGNWALGPLIGCPYWFVSLARIVPRASTPCRDLAGFSPMMQVPPSETTCWRTSMTIVKRFPPETNLAPRRGLRERISSRLGRVYTLSSVFAETPSSTPIRRSHFVGWSSHSPPDGDLVVYRSLEIFNLPWPTSAASSNARRPALDILPSALLQALSVWSRGRDRAAMRRTNRLGNTRRP